MILNIGNSHRGKTVEELIFNNPGYVLWMINTGAAKKNESDNRMVDYAHHALGLIKKFDKTTYIKKCCCCGQIANKCIAMKSVDKTARTIKLFCKKCLDSNSSELGRYTPINTYRSALKYVESNYKRYERDVYKKQLITAIAKLKGLPVNASATDFTKFFEYKKPEPFDSFFDD